MPDNFEPINIQAAITLFLLIALKIIFFPLFFPSKYFVSDIFLYNIYALSAIFFGNLYYLQQLSIYPNTVFNIVSLYDA